MTRNVKVSAYADLLSLKNRDNPRGNDTKFVEDDQKIFNFARDDLKNASTQISVRLLELLYSYTKSIGQISCGSIRATCWLLRDKLVITNHHVYQLCYNEREELQDPTCPSL